MIELSAVQKTSMGSLLSRANSGDVLSFALAGFLKENTNHGFGGSYNHPPVVERTAIIDRIVSEYIRSNPKAKILNLGCGFCLRYIRLAADTDVEWLDTDLPQVIELKREFLKQHSLPLPNYKTDVLDIKKVDLVREKEADLVIAEGCLSFVSESVAKQIISNRHIVFDVLTLKRTASLGSDQLWKYDPSRWRELNIINSQEFDTSPTRGAIVLEVDQRELAAEKSEADDNLLGA